MSWLGRNCCETFFFKNLSLHSFKLLSPREEGAPIWKGRGYSSEMLKKNPKRYQNLVLWAWLEFFFTPKKYNSKTKHYLLSYFSSKAPAVDLLRLNSLRRTKTALVTPYAQVIIYSCNLHNINYYYYYYYYYGSVTARS